MLDLRSVTESLETVRAQLARRGEALDSLDRIDELAAARRGQITETEALRAERNAASKAMASLDKSSDEFAEKRASLKTLGGRIKELETSLDAVKAELESLVLSLPNPPHETTPDGKGEADNTVVRTWGEKPALDFEPKDHDDLGRSLNILDFERGAKLSGARFTVLRGAGARLERGLATFMLDLHTAEHGYTELWPPVLVKDTALVGTGQLPKFEHDVFHVGRHYDDEDQSERSKLYLSPTAEVQLTNYHAGEILDAGALPLAYTAFTPCFRSEAGSYGKDTRGFIRQHQFDKVELVHLCEPEQGLERLELLTKHAEAVLQKLGLHYRVVELCAGDLGFGAPQDLRPRGVAPRSGRLPRDLELLVVRRLPGAAREDPLPAGAEGEASLRPHAQRLGPRGRTHPRRDPRAGPAGGRLGRRARGPAPPRRGPRADHAAGRMKVLENVPLAPRTTLELGGPARWLVEARDDETIVEALLFARERELEVRVLGGGSNLVVADEGFDGLVLEVATEGVTIEGGRVAAKAGEGWDPLVARCTSLGLAGVECLAGIPGRVGATPIQNVGAYGQEVSQTIALVRALDRDSLEVVEIEPAACGFAYRDSAFKRDPGRLVVLEVVFELTAGGAPALRYGELSRALEGETPTLERVRETVVALRRRKSMVIDPSDENRRSAGSFFTNPIVDADVAERIAQESPVEVPRWPVEGGRVKLAAGWLIERAGMAKGTRRGAVGISSAHALALVHHGGGTTAELLALADEVREAVERRFGVRLEREPVLWKKK